MRRLIDPSAFVEDQHTSRSLASRFMEFGLSYLPASKTRAASDRRISDALNYTKVGEEMIRAPEIFIFDTCQRTIYEMEHYRWQEWKGKSAGEKSPNEKPVDKDDHMIENLGRALIQEPTFEPLTQNLGGTSEIPALDPYE